MAFSLRRTLGGALAGAAAAGVWAAQQPLDMRIFRVPYDDTELLGKAVTRSRAWPVAGIAMHLANGALFGALYANVAPRVPLPAHLKGPAAGLAEHLLTWPSTAVVGRLHPTGEDFPQLWGDHRAFAQATWRHLLFGMILGELEFALNGPGAEATNTTQQDEAPITVDISMNGHGDMSQASGIELI
ncbi:unannotated protein [freshwater metagenome]|uniref:Unannotated protein n=1 Tax=freshwater metagenome TaxID=449393 RepID=A0A6J7E4A4_9ZZZZ|nr:hypothetical protein [Actinomycetota bacterium]